MAWDLASADTGATCMRKRCRPSFSGARMPCIARVLVARRRPGIPTRKHFALYYSKSQGTTAAAWKERWLKPNSVGYAVKGLSWGC